MNPEATVQMPPQLSTIAPDVDFTYYVIYWVSVFFFVAIMAAMIYFCIKYRRRPGVKAEPTGHHTKLELFWTFAPLILLVVFFHWGFEDYMKGAVAPADSIEVRVRGAQWKWEFEHPNGLVQTGELTVPVSRPVRLVMSSEDVLHSFFVPDFRVKRDVVPGMYTTLWFEAVPQEGRDQYDVQVYCAEYCGAPDGVQGNAGHSAMLATIHVVSQEAYDTLMREGPAMPSECEGDEDPAACWGRMLYAQNGCASCHAIEGTLALPAPNFRGLWGNTERLTGGGSVTVDENYILESIREPQAKVVEGYGGVVMPPFRMSDRQIDAMVAFIRSLEQ